MEWVDYGQEKQATRAAHRWMQTSQGLYKEAWTNLLHQQSEFYLSNFVTPERIPKKKKQDFPKDMTPAVLGMQTLARQVFPKLPMGAQMEREHINWLHYNMARATVTLDGAVLIISLPRLRPPTADIPPIIQSHWAQMSWRITHGSSTIMERH